MRAPRFWQTHNGLAILMAPLGQLFNLGGKIRESITTPKQINKPVLCVGNLVAGGAGKTPVCLSLVPILQKMGKKPHFLAKGYKGSIKAPTCVDTNAHTFKQVGDEPLLLAAAAPTWIAHNRAEGAPLAAQGCDIVIMDDGMQNPTIAKDCTLLVVDGGYGFGNAKVMPAGPLRENLEKGLAKANAVAIIGDDDFQIETLVSLRTGLPVFKAEMRLQELPEAIRHKPLVAFAGIGRPEKFFTSIRNNNGTVAETASFPDHYPYLPKDLEKLQRMAKAHKAALVTTVKDYLRLPEDFQRIVTPLPAQLHWHNPAAIEKFLTPLFAKK